MTDTVTPTQVDRDAASRFMREYHLDLADTNNLAEDFARHRLAAEATQAAEIARLREDLETALSAQPSEQEGGE